MILGLWTGFRCFWRFAAQLASALLFFFFPLFPFGYVVGLFLSGALGSTSTHAQRVARRTEAGLAVVLHRIHAPVGLDLGGRAPVEIAVSILAQVIQARYAK